MFSLIRHPAPHSTFELKIPYKSSWQQGKLARAPAEIVQSPSMSPMESVVARGRTCTVAEANYPELVLHVAGGKQVAGQQQDTDAAAATHAGYHISVDSWAHHRAHHRNIIIFCLPRYLGSPGLCKLELMQSCLANEA